MTRQDLIESLTQLGLTQKQAFQSVEVFFNTIVSALREEKKVSIVGLGTWEWKKRIPRLARNPKTGKVVALGSRKVLVFKPSRLIKNKLKS
ncbi:MAG TPA: HU family DNA-binding protein [bacterium]|nr:HU family DNA-binding protein [bacterium]